VKEKDEAVRNQDFEKVIYFLTQDLTSKICSQLTNQTRQCYFM